MVIKQMNKTKIVIALVAVATLTLVIIGLASAQVATPGTTAANGGFLGWIGRCFDFRGSQSNTGNPYLAPQAPTNNPNTAPYQGNPGYGYGPCWARW
jgi:hypothetical protein